MGWSFLKDTQQAGRWVELPIHVNPFYAGAHKAYFLAPGSSPAGSLVGVLLPPQMVPSAQDIHR